MFNAVRNESGGEWYLGVYCRKCRAPIPVFHDPGRGAVVAGGTGKLTVACPRCGKKAHYASFEMTAFLVPADRTAAADRAAVNDDHPVDRETPSSETGKAEIDAEDESEFEPVLDLAPYEIPDIEPESTLELEEEDVALELEEEAAPESEPEPVVDSRPAVEPAPAIEIDASVAENTGPEIRTPEITEPQIAEPGRDAAPALELAPPEPPEPAPALVAEPAPEASPVVDEAPSRAPELDLALELEAFFESHLAPEHVAEPPPAVDAPAPVPETTAPPADDSLKAFFESLPVEEPAPTADAPAPTPETAAPQADDSLEAFFESRSIAAPAPTADESPVGNAPVHGAVAAGASAPVAPEVPAPVAAVPPPPEPPAAAAPKPISQIYRERWAEPALRPRVVVELRPILRSLKGRAEAERDDIVMRVADLCLDYLDAVTPQHQSAAAIEQYINAVFTLAGRTRSPGTDRIGEEIAASLRALNRRAGLYISH